MRALIVSPHFPPVNSADMQRVRMLLPFFQENGWRADVLAVAPEHVAAPLDPWLCDGLPATVRVHHASALGLRWAGVPGLGTLGLRALWGLAAEGDRLLAKGNYDLVYFSTTVFEVHVLGPRWKRKFGTPFVVDYQDPWVNDYYCEHPDLTPPGGRLKYALVDKLHRLMEPRVLRECAGVTSVSPAYPKQLSQRYPWLKNLPSIVQPFPGAQRDFERLKSSVKQSLFDSFDGAIHWVYAGVVIPGMYSVLHSFFKAIAREMPDDKKRRLRLHFIGTCYVAGERARPQLGPLAHEAGLTDQVQEYPARIAYSQVLKCLTDAHALIAVGSDDPGYTASKIYPYLLARKPLLAIYHESSSVVQLIRKVGGATCVTFGTPADADDLAQRIGEIWLHKKGYSTLTELNVQAFEPYTDRGGARVLLRFLESRLAHV